MIFFDFGLDLDSSTNQGASLSERQGCTITIDLTIPRGKAIENLDQTVLAGIYKTEGASGSIETRALMFHDRIALQSLNVKLPRDRFIDSPLAGWDSQHNFSYKDLYSQCLASQRRPLRTRFQFEVALSGQKRSAFDAIVLNFDSSDLTFNVTPRLRDCRQVLANPPPSERPRPVPRPIPNDPNEPENPEPKIPDSDKPVVTPGVGIRLIANRTTSYLPNGSGRCTINAGQAIYVTELPTDSGWADVTLVRRPNSCTKTDIDLNGSINLSYFRRP